MKTVVPEHEAANTAIEKLHEQQVLQNLHNPESQRTMQLKLILNDAGNKRMLTPKVIREVEILMVNEGRDQALATETYVKILAKNPDLQKEGTKQFLGVAQFELSLNRDMVGNNPEVKVAFLRGLYANVEGFYDLDSTMRARIFECLGAPSLAVRNEAVRLIENKFKISTDVTRQIAGNLPLDSSKLRDDIIKMAGLSEEAEKRWSGSNTVLTQIGRDMRKKDFKSVIAEMGRGWRG
ncbi:hypothetical protein H0N98_02865 [Candidatus Micrarchaeota archaeon]|nr:hypothetical protein [Candidatus Micrarchaeota archaeon]